mmetsp:Transcript_44149/g.141525  ORF Transcript_44149/g.141525 Transcript_44149/m.141525 type:complete len:128 (-) Transcript_44149:1098-1481(-)
MDCGTVNQPAQWLSSNFRDLEGLSSDLCCTLLFDDTTSDVALQVQDARMPAHRAILAARSPVFKAMFFGPMLESGAAEVARHKRARQRAGAGEYLFCADDETIAEIYLLRLCRGRQLGRHGASDGLR